MKSLTEKTTKVKRQCVRNAARKAGIWNFRELARRVPCSVTSIYLAIERPSRYPRVHAKIMELTGL